MNTSKTRTVSKAGDKFTCAGELLTVKSFFSKDGIEYSNLKDCRANSKGTLICIKNKEYGGTTLLETSKLV